MLMTDENVTCYEVINGLNAKKRLDVIESYIKSIYTNHLLSFIPCLQQDN